MLPLNLVTVGRKMAKVEKGQREYEVQESSVFFSTGRIITRFKGVTDQEPGKYEIGNDDLIAGYLNSPYFLRMKEMNRQFEIPTWLAKHIHSTVSNWAKTSKAYKKNATDFKANLKFFKPEDGEDDEFGMLHVECFRVDGQSRVETLSFKHAIQIGAKTDLQYQMPVSDLILLFYPFSGLKGNNEGKGITFKYKHDESHLINEEPFCISAEAWGHEIDVLYQVVHEDQEQEYFQPPGSQLNILEGEGEQPPEEPKKKKGKK